MTAAVRRGFTGLALFNQLYSPSWFAFELGNGLSLPSHVRADGWRNAWFITRPGTLIVINLVNTFVVAALVLGLGVIAWQIKRIRA